MTNEHLEADKIAHEKHLMELEDELKETESIWLYLEHREEFSKQFSLDLIKAFYIENPYIAKNIRNTIISMKNVESVDPSATIILAMTSLEVLTKNVVLRPFLTGMLHSGPLANMLVRQVLHQNGLDRFNNLIYWIIDEFVEHIECKASELKLEKTNQNIWQVRSTLQKVRNSIIHKAEPSDKEHAELAISLLRSFDDLTSQLLHKLGLRYILDENDDLIIAETQSYWSYASIMQTFLPKPKPDLKNYHEPPMDFSDEVPF